MIVSKRVISLEIKSLRFSDRRSIPKPRPWVTKLEIIIADIHGEIPRLKSESCIKFPPVAKLAMCRLAFSITSDFASV